VVKVRLSDSEMRVVQSRAAVRDRHVGEYVRLAALGKLDPKPQPSRP
jgi:hypothetical protein